MISFMPELNPAHDLLKKREWNHDQEDYDMVIDGE
jgi:hypothetical protein